MKFLLPEHQRKWILWILDAVDSDETEFEMIHRVLQRYGSFTVPIREITRAGVEFRSSGLVKKLLKHGFLRISTTEFELHPRHMGTVSELSDELKKFYTEFHHARIPDYTHFPSGGFSSLPEEAISIDADELNNGLDQKVEKPETIYLITFTKKVLPPLLISGEFLQELPLFCWQKVRYHLAQLAGENGDFYSDKINTYKNLIIGRQREMLEGELAQIQRRTEKELREASTRTIFDRIMSSADVGRQVLSDLVSPENSYILTHYSFNSIQDFDFLQSLTLLEGLFLMKVRRRTIKAEDLLSTVREAINLSISRKELEQLALNAYPETDEKEIHQAFSRLRELYIGHGARHPELLAFEDPAEGTVYLHQHNMEALIDSRGVRLQNSVKATLERRWLSMLEQHRFEEAMQSDKAFRELLQRLAVKEQPGTAAILRSTSLYRFISDMNIKSAFVARLKDHNYAQIDLLFEIDREKFYQEIYRTAYTSYPWFRALLFRLFHWLAWSVFQNQPQESKTQKKPEPSESSGTSEDEILARLGKGNGNEVAAMLQEIWNRLPSDILPREEIDRNILTDLNAFYSERAEVVFASLSFIVDRNLRRILQKASHLEGYSQPLREYIEAKMTSLIAGRSDLRGKTRL